MFMVIATFFNLYGLTRDNAACVLDTSPIVHRRDEDTYSND